MVSQLALAAAGMFSAILVPHAGSPSAPLLCPLCHIPGVGEHLVVPLDFRALCRVPGPGMVAMSFEREKGTCDLLCQCWVLPDPQCGAGRGKLSQGCVGQGEGGAHSLGI